jgi:hypothetical protein
MKPAVARNSDRFGIVEVITTISIVGVILSLVLLSR